MIVHTIGDSHAKYGWEKISHINVHHIGPKLCYTIGKNSPLLVKEEIKLEDEAKKWEPIEPHQCVIFCFGEIDCRCHIHKHIDENISYKDIIDDLVCAYFKTLKKNEDVILNLKIGVYNVPPPCKKYEQAKKEEFPFLGSDYERKIYIEYFNQKLKETCAEYKYFYFDVYDRYKDDDGFLIKELSDGSVHIDNQIFIKEELERMKQFFGVVA